MKSIKNVRAEGNIQFVSLPLVAEVERSQRKSRKLFSLEFRSATLFQFCEDIPQVGMSAQHNRARIIAYRVREQDAYCGKRSGQGRDQHPRNTQRVRQRTRMERPSSPKRDQCEITRVVPTFDRDHPNGLLHRGFNQPQDPGCELLHACDGSPSLFHVCEGAFTVEADCAAQKTFGVKPAQNQIGIRHGYLFTTAKTDRSRRRPGGLRSYTKHATGIEAGQ